MWIQPHDSLYKLFLQEESGKRKMRPKPAHAHLHYSLYGLHVYLYIQHEYTIHLLSIHSNDLYRINQLSTFNMASPTTNNTNNVSSSPCSVQDGLFTFETMAIWAALAFMIPFTGTRIVGIAFFITICSTSIRTLVSGIDPRSGAYLFLIFFSLAAIVIIPIQFVYFLWIDISQLQLFRSVHYRKGSSKSSAPLWLIMCWCCPRPHIWSYRVNGNSQTFMETMCETFPHDIHIFCHDNLPPPFNLDSQLWFERLYRIFPIHIQDSLTVADKKRPWMLLERMCKEESHWVWHNMFRIISVLETASPDPEHPENVPIMLLSMTSLASQRIHITRSNSRNALDILKIVFPVFYRPRLLEPVGFIVNFLFAYGLLLFRTVQDSVLSCLCCAMAKPISRNYFRIPNTNVVFVHRYFMGPIGVFVTLLAMIVTPITAATNGDWCITFVQLLLLLGFWLVSAAFQAWYMWGGLRELKNDDFVTPTTPWQSSRIHNQQQQLPQLPVVLSPPTMFSQIRVQVPPNWVPGSMLICEGPQGQFIQVLPPLGAIPGSEFYVNVS
jgi:hypothetical protein